MAESTYFETKAYGGVASEQPLERVTILRRVPKAKDVHIEVKYAGICHSDIHTIREEWGPVTFPQVVGHEIGGYVKAVGSEVTKFKVGDKVGVGCMVNSCRSCVPCQSGEEQYCSGGFVGTYASNEKYPHCGGFNDEGGEQTHGGYCQDIVVDESFVLNIPESLDLAAATPLMCAGITVYSPMSFYNLRPGQKLAVAGLGGLGHMAVKIGVAWGCEVTVLSRGTGKRDEALNKLGAHHFVNSKVEEEMKACSNQFDMIIDTIAAVHDVGAYLATVAPDGRMVMVGAPPGSFPLPGAGSLIGKRKSLCGSLIGGVRETQEMLNFCALHNITCEIEMCDADYINEAYERTCNSDVKYRFVIDTSTL